MITYKLLQKKLGAQAILQASGTVSTKQLAMLIEEKHGIPAIRVMDVMAALAEEIKTQARSGAIVSLDGIGSLRPKLAIEQGNVVVKGLSYLSTKAVKDALKQAQLVAVE